LIFVWLAVECPVRLLFQPVEEPKSPKSRRPRRKVFLAVLAGLLVAAYFLHGLLLERIVRSSLKSFGESHGLVVEADKIKARMGSPVVIERLRIRAEDAATSRTAAQIERMEFAMNWPTAMFGKNARLVRLAALEDARLVLDLRSGIEPKETAPMLRMDDSSKKRQAKTRLWFFPIKVELSGIEAEVISDEGAFSISNINADFNEAAPGQFSASNMEIRFGGVRQVFAAQKGSTAWKNGEAFLADMTLRNGMTIENLSVQLARPGGVGVDANAAIFGGFLRGGAFFGEWRGEPGVDAAVWASGFNFAEVAKFLGLEKSAGGSLREGRFTFRGNPDRPLDAESSLRISAENFRWGERGWETLEAGVSLINRRLSLGELQLKQKENFVSANGEIALGGDWKDVAASPFLLNVSASIQEMSSLGELFGPPFDELVGRMSFSAALNGRSRKVDGFLAVETSGMEIRGRKIESGKLDVLFARGEAKVERLEVWSQGDYLRGQGEVAMESPHTYSGQLQGRVKDLSGYAWLPDNPLPITEGGTQFRWSGDGTRQAHSGAFNVSVNQLVTDWSPEGITGRFSGTYSPGNIYFGGFELEKGPATIHLKATLAESGVRLDDFTFLQSKKELASGEFFLPVDPYKLAQGGGLAGSILPDKFVHARLETRGDIAVRELVALFGHQAPLRGLVRGGLTVSGKPSALEIAGGLQGRGMQFEGSTAPPMDVRLDASASAGIARVNGALTPKGFPVMGLQAEFPFGLGVGTDGSAYLINPNGELKGAVDIPRTELALLQPFLPGISSLSGELSGTTAISGSLSAPRFTGRLGVRDASVTFSPVLAPLEKLQADVQLSGDQIVLQSATAEMGAGPLKLSGSVAFTDFTNPKYQFTMEGSQILLHRSTDLRLRSDISLNVEGSNEGGKVTGGFRLVDGRLFKRLEITPFIAPTPAQSARPFVAPVVSGLVPAPFDAWTLNVGISNATPFSIVGNVASGEIQPELQLGGTLGNPTLSGQIRLANARAFLPFTSMDIPDGLIRFDASNPWMPILDIRGFAEVLDYDIRLHATGPLSEGRLGLRSDPPLPQESIILLLTTGLAPGFHAGAGFGQAAAGQGGMLLLRTLLRQFDLRGIDTESLLNRLQVSAVPPALPGRSSGLRARLKLTESVSLMSEQDDLGFYNVGATYRFRFR
jgi:hypothetical protein